jgi:hypothetical protein
MRPPRWMLAVVPLALALALSLALALTGASCDQEVDLGFSPDGGADGGIDQS